MDAFDLTLARKILKDIVSQGWAHNRRARLCYMSLTPDGWELRVQWDSLGLHIGHLASEDFLFYYLI